MSNLIRRRQTVTSTHSLPPPIATSAVTAPAQLNEIPVVPNVSHAPVSSESSVAQPVSARRRHRPPHLMDTASTSSAGASGQEEHPGTLSLVEYGEAHSGDQHSYRHQIRRASSGCTYGGPT
ncbi:hypothetical protein ACE6H2_026347 [Prunus campanulata]